MTLSRRTPLHCCAQHGGLAQLEVLLAWGAHVQQGSVDKNGLTPLAYAVLRAARGCATGKLMLASGLLANHSV